MAVECVSASFAMQHFNFITPKIRRTPTKSVPRLVEIDALGGKGLPQIDALYIGGGFPKLMRLIGTEYSFRDAVRNAAEKGLPIVCRVRRSKCSSEKRL